MTRPRDVAYCHTASRARGIGYIINDARSFSLTAVIFVGILVFAAVGKLTDSIVRLAESRLLRWQDNRQGGGA